MLKKIYLIIISLFLIGCFNTYDPLKSEGGSILVENPEELAAIASLSLNFKQKNDIAEISETQIAIINTENTGSSASTLLSDKTIVREDGTIIRTVSERDDKNTSDQTDDMVITTQTITYPYGDVRITVTKRPITPLASWACFNISNRYLALEGTFTTEVNGFMQSSGTVQYSYEKRSDKVYVIKIRHINNSISRTGVIYRTITITDISEDNTKTIDKLQYRINSTGESIIIYSYKYSEYTDSEGIVWTKQIRDDGRYWLIRTIVLENKSIYKFYDVLHRLRVMRTEIKNMATGVINVVRLTYNNLGELVNTENYVLNLKYSDNGLHTQKKSDDGSTVNFIIKEKGTGYIIIKNGVNYIVEFIDKGVKIIDTNGVSAIVMFDDQGGWTIDYLNKKGKTI